MTGAPKVGMAEGITYRLFIAAIMELNCKKLEFHSFLILLNIYISWITLRALPLEALLNVSSKFLHYYFIKKKTGFSKVCAKNILER
jgi:hypothetical protein